MSKTSTRKKPKSGRRVVLAAKGATMPADGSWPKSVCDHLRKLRSGHLRNVNKIAKMEKERKALAEQIDQLNETEAEGRKGEALKAECYDVEQLLKACRAQVRWYADKMADAITAADQGEMFEDARTTPTEADLFSHGRKPKETRKTRKVESLEGLTDSKIKALKEAGLATLNDVDKHDFTGADLGLTLGDIEEIHQAIKRAQGVDPLSGDDEDEADAEGDIATALDEEADEGSDN